jgi:predicted RNA-binding Zn ribbon-like protein
MAEQPGRHPAFDFIGGNAALDFSNTLGGLRGGTTHEHLRGYSDLAAWAVQASLLDRRTARSLRRTAKRKPQVSGRVFARSLAAREALYAVFSAAAARENAPTAALDLINGELSAALSRLRIKPIHEGFVWELPGDDAALDLPLWAVVREAAELLTSNRLGQVRECSGDACSWLFLDTTRNHSRLWCDMRGCGNRAKVRRHRTRHRRPSEPLGDIRSKTRL